ncbi:hypothetical protein P5673_005785 [Acropora cervicornis]|uniref:Uncharacterized protein n=1 Tax=Acropora cervicornis TaxID=6130 RepID=A0AAD9VCZ5_ACRCE|nr:hypothetical protein P5673_005785 [Acropora cervicornis]
MHWKTNPQGLSYAYRILGQIECMIHRSDTQRNVVAKTDSIDGKHRATNSQARSLKRRHPRILSEWMIRRGKTAFNTEVKREPCTEFSDTNIYVSALFFSKGTTEFVQRNAATSIPELRRRGIRHESWTT